MKKLLSLVIFTLMVMIAFTVEIKAACNNEGLTISAEEMEVDFRLPISEEEDVAYYLHVSNPTEAFYLKIYDSLSSEVIKVSYADVDFFAYVIKSEVHFDEKKYTIEIVSDLDGICKDEVVRTIEYIVPPFNKYSTREECKGNFLTDICKPFHDTSEISEADFEKEINKKQDENEETNKTTFEKIMSYAIYILIPIGVIGVYFIVRVILIRRKKHE